jgi:hypothetical protein
MLLLFKMFIGSKQTVFNSINLWRITVRALLVLYGIVKNIYDGTLLFQSRSITF